VISIFLVATASQQTNLKLCSVINQTLRATRTPREGHRWYVSLLPSTHCNGLDRSSFANTNSSERNGIALNLVSTRRLRWAPSQAV